jgi:nucleoside-diphosphate-sugar epimerase
MNVLIIGGAGKVASLVIPHLRQKHTLRVFDLKPPADVSLDYQVGNVTDFDALAQAAQGMDALLYMAMGSTDWDTLNGINSAFDANVKGLFLALKALRQAGGAHAVHCSTMSVYDGDLMTRYFFDEDMPPDGRNVYGLTKRLGEEVCRNACYQYGMSVNALRLCYPTADEDWLANTPPGAPTLATAASDVARVMLAALAYRNSFQAFMVSGDYENKIMNLSKAKRVLGWAPLLRPLPR